MVLFGGIAYVAWFAVVFILSAVFDAGILKWWGVVDEWLGRDLDLPPSDSKRE
jgi:hypothetical protein